MRAGQDFKEAMIEMDLLIKARSALDNFNESVENAPGFTDDIQKILNIIDDIVLGKEKEQFEKELKQGTKYYRARIINPKDDGNSKTGLGKTIDGKFKGYNDMNSREPLLGIGGEGRNNISGVSYLYMASNPETACMEVKSQFADLISLATFELREPLKIIDFSDDKTFQREDSKVFGLGLGALFTQLMFRYTEPVKGGNGYRATQVISDHLRKTGIDGIAYRSFLTPGGINYTIFNSHPQKIHFCESKVLIHKQANHSFWDFNEACEIMSNRNGKWMNWNDDIAKEHKKRLSKRFKVCDE